MGLVLDVIPAKLVPYLIRELESMWGGVILDSLVKPENDEVVIWISKANESNMRHAIPR